MFQVLADRVLLAPSGPPGPRGPQDIVFAAQGNLSAGEVLPICTVSHALALAGGGSIVALTAPAADATFLIDYIEGGVTAPVQVGTAFLPAGMKVGTVTIATPQVLNPDDVLTCTAPNPADTSLADVGITVAGA